ncbi:hypothetical protein AVEN_227864-1 [Araneus ventricosus]|uniref:Uncharacterized protein n=1 Tax=Araneus ventricosus TaxID=182803 RepID=A0A4Y2QF56_ARAVE|nr:hypothetical protein AVEN_240221-1 [Araneus ventricosus]GBN68549.1 hypothetical protein AVEN_227864-1 [Araneus ventricosus]
MVNPSVLSVCLELKHSPLAVPVITVARTTFGHKCGICNRVTLRSLGTSRLHINNTGTPALNFILFDGTPKNSEELKNSAGYDVACYCPLPYIQIHILHL